MSDQKEIPFRSITITLQDDFLLDSYNITVTTNDVEIKYPEMMLIAISAKWDELLEAYFEKIMDRS